jgi:hypothetical protein
MTPVVAHPIVRIALPLLVVVALFITSSLSVLISGYALGLLPLFIVERKVKVHLRFLLYGVVPIVVTGFILYGVVLKVGGDAWHELSVRGAKFLVGTTALQWALTIPRTELTYTFKTWGLRGSTLIVLLGSFTLWADLQKAANRIVTARLASGVVGGRSPWIMVRQLPLVLLPMVISMLRTSTVRSHSWNDKDIVELVSTFEPDARPSIGYSVVLVALGCAFLTSALIAN